MSFSVREEATGIEWNGRNLDSVYAQRSNVLRPGFHRMVLDILRFNREAPELLENGDEIPLGEYLRSRRYSRAFTERLYILPMGAAIWSASPEEMLTFPARFFVRFFHNHGFLQVADRPVWRVVEGGSARYVEALIAAVPRAYPRAHAGARAAPTRHVEVEHARGEVEHFDEVVIATHSDQALALLDDPTPAERESARRDPLPGERRGAAHRRTPAAQRRNVSGEHGTTTCSTRAAGTRTARRSRLDE